MAGVACHACHAKNRAQIDAALVSGVSIRDTAARFKLGRGTIERHRAHIADLVPMTPRTFHEDPESFAALLKRILVDSKRIAASAEDAEEWGAAVAAIREQARIAEIAMRVDEAQAARDRADGQVADGEWDLSRLTPEELGQLRAIRLKLSGAIPALDVVGTAVEEESHE